MSGSLAYTVCDEGCKFSWQTILNQGKCSALLKFLGDNTHLERSRKLGCQLSQLPHQELSLLVHQCLH